MQKDMIICDVCKGVAIEGEKESITVYHSSSSVPRIDVCGFECLALISIAELQKQNLLDNLKESIQTKGLKLVKV